MVISTQETFHPALFSSPPIREVEMEVVFGTPSRNCSGAGICMIASRLPHGQIISCPHAPAIIHYDPKHELVFRFRKQCLSDEIVQGYFSSNCFVVEEAFSLPQRLIRMWELPISSIASGRYSLEEYSREWRLYFPLDAAPNQQSPGLGLIASGIELDSGYRRKIAV